MFKLKKFLIFSLALLFLLSPFKVNAEEIEEEIDLVDLVFETNLNYQIADPIFHAMGGLVSTDTRNLSSIFSNPAAFSNINIRTFQAGTNAKINPSDISRINSFLEDQDEHSSYNAYQIPTEKIEANLQFNTIMNLGEFGVAFVSDHDYNAKQNLLFEEENGEDEGNEENDAEDNTHEESEFESLAERTNLNKLYFSIGDNFKGQKINLSAGVNIKGIHASKSRSYYHSEIDIDTYEEDIAYGYAVDIGFLFNPVQQIDLAFSYKNFTSDINKSDEDLVIARLDNALEEKMLIGLNVYSNTLNGVFNFDIEKPENPEKETSYRMGIETSVSDYLILRGGANRKGEEDISYSGGIGFNHYHLDVNLSMDGEENIYLGAVVDF